MRSRTRRSPFPHGTTTRTAPKQTVTFIIRTAFLFVFPSYLIFFTLWLLISHLAHTLLPPSRRLFLIKTKLKQINGKSFMVTFWWLIHFSTWNRRICVTNAGGLFVDMFSSLLSYRRSCSASWKRFVINSSLHNKYHGRCFYSLKTSQKFLLSHFIRGSLTLSHVCVCVCVSMEPLFPAQLFHKTEWNKKKTLNTTRGLYEKFENRFFVYQLWMFFCCCCCLCAFVVNYRLLIYFCLYLCELQL